MRASTEKTRTPLDHTFWKRFAKSYWEKRPGHFKNLKSSIFSIDSKFIFERLVAYSNHCRKTKTTKGMKLFLDGRKQYPEVILEFLPVLRDRSLRGYHHRMDQLFDDYCLICDELLQVSKTKWKLLRTLLSDITKHVGTPVKLAEVGLYLGNYRKTPFGVHVDGCGVFSFPVEGTKHFRLWHPDFVTKHPKLRRTFDTQAFNKNSKLIKAKVGTLTYWPSTYWHIAESDGTFNATWSLGIWL